MEKIRVSLNLIFEGKPDQPGYLVVFISIFYQPVFAGLQDGYSVWFLKKGPLRPSMKFYKEISGVNFSTLFEIAGSVFR